MNEDWADTLRQLRTDAKAGADPVRVRWMEAMVERLGRYEGRARTVIEGKLRVALESLVQGQGTGPSGRLAAARVDQGPGPLAVLLREVAVQSAAVVGHEPSQGAGTGGDLKALSHFRGTWTRLSTERRLHQSLAAVPQQAGPLNSQQLMNRTLRSMHEASPEYLQRFISHVDSMLWLEQFAAGQASSAMGAVEGAGATRSKPAGGTRRRAR